MDFFNFSWRLLKFRKKKVSVTKTKHKKTELRALWSKIIFFTIFQKNELKTKCPFLVLIYNNE